MDSSDQLGAVCLADKIQCYWHRRGYRGVKVWVEPFKAMDGKRIGTFYEIKSNIAEQLGHVPHVSHAVLRRASVRAVYSVAKPAPEGVVFRKPAV